MYIINEDLIIRNIDSKYVIINMETGEITTFDGTGNIFFESLYKLKDKTKMYEYLLKKYDVGEEQLQEDITEFLKTLLEKNIVQYMEDNA